MIDSYEKLSGHVAGHLGEALSSSEIKLGELALCVRPQHLLRALSFLRDDSECRFEMLVDLCGVDYPDREKRFEVVYNLLSLRHNRRVRVKVEVGEDEGVPTAIDLYPAAGWFEREAYDLYGIFFDNHPDLRRILTDYGFQGHPLRKDFPLTGYVQVRYDEEQKRVINEPVQLVQEFRSFDFLSPWEGMLQPRPLPGDEKA